MKTIHQQIANLPQSPGVYFFKDAKGAILYIGKASSLKARIASWFQAPADAKGEILISQVKKIEHLAAGSSIEALLLEARLIKKYSPKYNVKLRDDKSFLYLAFPKIDFSYPAFLRGQIMHGLTELEKRQKFIKIFGPFPQGGILRQAIRVLRRVFPYHCGKKVSRPCIYYQLGQCPGPCAGLISVSDYQKIIQRMILFLEGRKTHVFKELERQMKIYSQQKQYEKAGRVRDQIAALKSIGQVILSNFDRAILGDSPSLRIESYDISNISGREATGSMAVFIGEEPDKNEYRRFKIKTVFGADDPRMLAEIVRRRFQNPWPKPDLIVLDGGKTQLSAVKKVTDNLGLKIPLVAVAKGKNRHSPSYYFSKKITIDKKIIISASHEAHRFALAYHRKLRDKRLFKK